MCRVRRLVVGDVLESVKNHKKKEFTSDLLRVYFFEKTQIYFIFISSALDIDVWNEISF